MSRRAAGTGQRKDADRVRRVRALLALSQRDFAGELGVAPSAVAQWESEKRACPGPVRKLLDHYERELGVDSEVASDAAEVSTGWLARTRSGMLAAIAWSLLQRPRTLEVHSPFSAALRGALARSYVTRVAELRGLALKMAQLLADFDFALGEPERQALGAALASMTPMPNHVLTEIFLSDFGATPPQLFARFAADPFAMASIGQVHRAELRGSGVPVAVKVQYPRIVEALEADLKNVEILERVAAALLRTRHDEVFGTWRAHILAECDYGGEAAHQRTFAGIFADRSGVRIPAPVDELSSRRVLTASFIEGESLDVFRSAASQAARNRAAETVWQLVIEPMFTRGLLYADVHAQNFIFADRYVGLVDFGRVQRLTPRYVAGYTALVRAVLERDTAAIDRLTLELGAVRDPAKFDLVYNRRLLVKLFESCLVPGPYHFTADYLADCWRLLALDNPNRGMLLFSADSAFLHHPKFCLCSILARLDARVNARAMMLDLLYRDGEVRPRPYEPAELTR